jgi:hypothetical protein
MTDFPPSSRALVRFRGRGRGARDDCRVRADARAHDLLGLTLLGVRPVRVRLQEP